MQKILKLPRNIIENDPSWLTIPSENPQMLAWINNGLNLTAKCGSNDVVCDVFQHLLSEPLLPDLFNYRGFINSGNQQISEIRKYLSSIYLNPSQNRPRFNGKSRLADNFHFL